MPHRWRTAGPAAWAAAVLLACSTAVCHGSLQGLYGMSAGDGQLYFVNWTSGEEHAVGPSLKSRGFVVDDCVPTSLDTTGKWMYLLGRNASSSKTPPHLTLLAIQLEDAALHTVKYDLVTVAGFDPNASACDHTIVAGFGWMAYVSAAVNGFLRTWSFSCDHSFEKACAVIPGQTSPTLVAAQDLAAFNLGGFPPVAASALDDLNRLWVALEGGAVGMPMRLRNKTAVDRVARAPTGHSLVGLQRGFGTGQVMGVLTDNDNSGSSSSSNSNSTNVGSNNTGTPGAGTSREATIQAVPNATTLPFPVGHHGAAVSLLSDQGLLAIAADDGRFATVDFSGAHPTVLAPCAAGNSASLAYQPFVF